MSIQFSRGRKEASFKTDKFPREAFCLVSQNPLSCFPSNLCHRFTPQGEAEWKRRLGRKEKPGKSMCWAISESLSLSHVWKIVQVTWRGGGDADICNNGIHLFRELFGLSLFIPEVLKQLTWNTPVPGLEKKPFVTQILKLQKRS